MTESRLKTVAIYNRFTVKDELAKTFQELGYEYRFFSDVSSLKSLISEFSPHFVFDVNVHPELRAICAETETIYTSWAFDSGIPYVLRHIGADHLRDNDYFFMFDQHDVDEGLKLHKNVWYLPYSAGNEFICPPRTKDFECDVAFIMNSYHDTIEESSANLSREIENSSSESHRKLLILAQKLSEAAITMSLDNITADQLTPSFDLLIKKCGVDPFLGRESSRRRFLRGIGQSLSSQQREICLRTLGQTGRTVHVYGDDYWKSITEKNPSLIYKGTAPYHKLKEIYNTAKININLTQIQNLASIPQRIFHFMAAGAFFLSNPSPALDSMLSRQKHYDGFCNFDIMKKQIEYYLSNEKQRIEIAEKAHQEFLDNHRMSRRLAFLIKTLSSK